MPRSNRYILPGYIYHVTHRCHDRRFLLKVGMDRTDVTGAASAGAPGVPDRAVRLLYHQQPHPPLAGVSGQE
jgi:hypothetical protein